MNKSYKLVRSFVVSVLFILRFRAGLIGKGTPLFNLNMFKNVVGRNSANHTAVLY